MHADTHASEIIMAGRVCVCGVEGVGCVWVGLRDWGVVMVGVGWVVLLTQASGGPAPYSAPWSISGAAGPSINLDSRSTIHLLQWRCWGRERERKCAPFFTPTMPKKGQTGVIECDWVGECGGSRILERDAKVPWTSPFLRVKNVLHCFLVLAKAESICSTCPDISNHLIKNIFRMRYWF